MTDLYIFDPNDNLLAVLSNESDGSCPFKEAPFREQLNQGSTFEFVAPADHEDSQYIVAENQVAFKDKDGAFRLFVITEPEKTNDSDGPAILAVCSSAMLELNDEIIKDIRPYNTTLRDAATRALSGTRWKVGEMAELGLNSTNFYYITVAEAITQSINTWGGELRDRVEIKDNKITGRFIDILPRRGMDTGKRWEIDKDILKITHKSQSYPKTALYGRGSSLLDDTSETEEYTRKINFADVVWSVAKGDPVDKPAGQEWVGDPVALQLYGRKNDNGTLRHRIGIFESSDQEDAKALLKETWDALQEQKKPIENYEMDVFLLQDISGYEHEKVRLGDTTFAIDRSFAKPIEVEERIISFEYDISDPDNSGVVELGNFIDLYSDEDRLEQIESKLNDNTGVWNNGGKKPVTDDKIENITPAKPENVIASGLFQNVLVEWDFVNALYIANYEVYASQVSGFTPDISNLAWKGKSSMYTHKANTNEQWYFKVRAVNTHGVPGPLSEQVTANTARIITDDILFGSVTADLIAELAVEASKLAESAVTAEKIAALAVGTAAIQNLAVTNGKIANLAVGQGQIQDLAVTNAKIANLAVDNSKIANLSADKINAGSIRGIDIFGSQFRSTDGSTNLQIVGGDVRLTQNSGNYVNINPDGLFGYNSGGSQRFRVDKLLVTSAALGTSNSNVYLAPDANNEVRIVDINSIPSDGIAENYTYRPIRALGLRFGPGANGYIGTEGELRITSSGFKQDDGSVIYRDLRAAAIYGTAFITQTESAWIGTNSALHVVAKGTAEGSLNPIYRALYAGNIFGTSFITQTDNAYIGTNDELRVVNKGLSGIYRNVRANGYFGQFLTADPDFYAYIGTDLGLRVTSRGLASAGPVYRDVTAASFSNGSRIESKSDIVLWKDDALSIICESDLASYFLNGDIEQGREIRKYGLVIGGEWRTPQQVINGDGIDQYVMTSFAWRGLQQVNETQKTHTAEIQSLSEIVIQLRQEVNELKTA
ncbi:phage tail spike protein [Peribacillus frigoritolerans]|uniref:phage tail spike protein n=1 Tax=Peribacillus frigoritolerans TaxID=450367 RepID=UPI003D00420F